MLNGFTLVKLPSIYNNKTVLNEYTDLRLNSLIQNNIGIEFADDNYQKTHKGFVNEQAHLSTLISKYNKKEGCLKIKIKCPDHGWGRIQPEDHASLSVLHRPTRHSLCDKTYVDIDIVSCCQTVFKNVAEHNGKSYPFLNEYLENRDIKFESLMTKYNVSKDKIKNLFTSLSFGGHYNTWFNKNNITYDNEPFVINLHREYQELMEIIYDANPQICVDILKSNPNKFIKYTDPKDLLNKKKRTTMACFYQTCERYLQETMIDYLVKTKYFKLKDIVPCQDGFMPLSNLNYEGILDECVLVIKNKFNFNIKLKMKEFDEKFEIPPYVTDKELKEQLRLKKEASTLELKLKRESEKLFKEKQKFEKEEEKLQTIKLLQEQQQQQQQKEEKEDKLLEEELKINRGKSVGDFEKNHIKIINKGLYIIEGKEPIFKTKKQLVDTYEHLESIRISKYESTPFITYWTTNNPDIRQKDDMQIYPKASMCPKNIYNLWTPFWGELFKESYTPNLDALEFFKNHILILCDNDKVVADYIIKWIAQMIQYPEIKSICPIFISKEGSGKGTLLKFICLLLGASKYFETSNPARDVWGQFNSIMSSCFLVNLNELSKSDTTDSLGKIKALITDDAMTINQKNISPFQITSYHRFIITTNNYDPMPTLKGDRRFIMISSSNEKKGDIEYFTTANNYMKDELALRTIYDYLKSIPDMNTFGSIPLPITDYQKNIQEGNTSPIELWLKSFTIDNENEEEVELLGSQALDLFESWKTLNKIKFEINSIKLGVNLTNLKIDGIRKGRHTKKGETKYFNIKLLKQHFSIGLLIDLKPETFEETDNEGDE
jgi:hypothetical protein